MSRLDRIANRAKAEVIEPIDFKAREAKAKRAAEASELNELRQAWMGGDNIFR